MKLFLDTNILVRYFLSKPSLHHEQCVELIKHIQSTHIHPYISNIVVLELQYVLLKTYDQPKSTVTDYLAKTLHLRNLTLIEHTNTLLALKYYRTHNIKFGDCLIATQVPKGVALCTYDTDFTKIPSISVTTPAEILKSIASSSNKS